MIDRFRTKKRLNTSVYFENRVSYEQVKDANIFLITLTGL